MKHLFIVNPVAGGGGKTDLVRAKIVSAFAQRPGEELELYVTKAPLDATEKILGAKPGTMGFIRALVRPPRGM